MEYSEADALRTAGLRATRQRVETFRVFRTGGGPLCASEVMERLQGRNIDRATVYRAVGDLAGAGLIHHSYSVGRRSYYEVPDHCGTRECHAHFRCTQCKATMCLYDVAAVVPVNLPDGYVVEQSKMLVYGICPKCNKDEPLS